MIIGVPKEVKLDEYRVAMLPVGVEELTRRGHRVLIEHGAGLGSGLADGEYQAAGAVMAAGPEEIFDQSDLIVKVKEPQPGEWPLIRPGQIIFTYFHFAADRELTDAMLASRATAVAYETLADDRGLLPLLTPMSEVAGRMSIQEGAKYLERPQMGRGILLGGVPGVAPASITILGGGVVGANAAKIAAGFNADIAILDINMDRLRYLDDVMPPNVNCLFSDRHTIREQLSRADLVIGAVLIPGAKAPRLVEREDLKRMKPGSVIIDVAIDQGGCIATSRPTTHSQPDLHRRRRGALLRDQHARRRGPHQHVRAVQRDAAVGDRDRPARRRASRPRPAADRPGGKSACRRGDQQSRGRDVWPAAQPAICRMTAAPATLRWEGDVGGHLVLLDQTRLPAEAVELHCHAIEDVWQAIRRLAVRGAPAIGVAAAYGVCLSLIEPPDSRRATSSGNPGPRGGPAIQVVFDACDYLATSRPTAVNLFWALDRMRRIARDFAASRVVRDANKLVVPDPGALSERLLAEARAIHEEDRAMCTAIGRHGADLLADLPPGAGVLTHCNAGALATGGDGTALAVIFELARRGRQPHVWVDETRPLLQGARLTAWELVQRGVDCTVICDSMAAQVIREGRVQAVIVGADRIAANGDAANKIGTYGVAVLAAAHGAPFYVAAPTSTFDLSLASGEAIPIEERTRRGNHDALRPSDGARRRRRLQPGLRRHARATDRGDHHRSRGDSTRQRGYGGAPPQLAPGH